MHKLQHILLICLCLTATPVFGVAIGETVDTFRLRDLSGTFHSDADYRGKVLILAVIGYN
jgi:hypothetical protein